jgi:hypothetical protein
MMNLGASIPIVSYMMLLMMIRLRRDAVVPSSLEINWVQLIEVPPISDLLRGATCQCTISLLSDWYFVYVFITCLIDCSIFLCLKYHSVI